MPRKLASVVLVGRPNVGKSTLFNRITGSRRAIVAPVAGTTRDSLARPASWRGASFQVMDTGGLYGASEDPLHELVVRQGKRAIAIAEAVIETQFHPIHALHDGPSWSGNRGRRRCHTSRE